MTLLILILYTNIIIFFSIFYFLATQTQLLVLITMYALKYFNMFSFVIILQIVLGFYLFNIFLLIFQLSLETPNNIAISWFKVEMIFVLYVESINIDCSTNI